MNNWRYKKDNKLRGAFGETNYDTKTIRVNKKRHKKKNESMIDTLVHETLHKNHPQMHERTVRKKTKTRLASMSKKSKSKLYSKLG